MKLNPKKVKKILELKLLTQTELCEKADLTIATVNKAVNGVSVHASTVKKICEALNVDVKELL